jgi:hypothetical protein
VYKARHAGEDDHWGNEEKVAMENMEKKANDFEWDGMNVVTGAVEKQPWDEKWDCPSLTYKQRLSNHLSNDVLDVIAPKQDWGTVERVEDVGADKMEDIAGALPKIKTDPERIAEMEKQLGVDGIADDSKTPQVQ